jgi:hypothetical protein
VQELLEPGQLFSVRENDLGDPGALARPEAVFDRLADDRVLRKEPVDDLVARKNRCAMPRKRLQSLGLPGADPAGERDRKRSRRAYTA